MPRRKAITAGELLEKLSHDKEYQARMAAKERSFSELYKLRLEQDKLICQDLRSVGFKINSIWDLVNSKGLEYAQVLPVLISHLYQAHDPVVIEGIVRALTVPAARDIAWDPLISLLLTTKQKDSQEWVLSGAIINAICTMARQSDLDELVRLARMESIGGQGRIIQRRIKKLSLLGGQRRASGPRSLSR